jgi:glycerol-3-phosphate dehydrogenase
VEHFCANEWAFRLEDVMLRRTSWHFYHPDAPAMAERVADWMSALLGWSDTEKAAELQRYRRATGLAPNLPRSHASHPAAATV